MKEKKHASLSHSVFLFLSSTRAPPARPRALAPQPYTLPHATMGVTGLWSLLEPCGRRVNIETLAGKRIAVGECCCCWCVPHAVDVLTRCATVASVSEGREGGKRPGI